MQKMNFFACLQVKYGTSQSARTHDSKNWISFERLQTFIKHKIGTLWNVLPLEVALKCWQM